MQIVRILILVSLSLVAGCEQNGEAMPDHQAHPVAGISEAACVQPVETEDLHDMLVGTWIGTLRTEPTGFDVAFSFWDDNEAELVMWAEIENTFPPMVSPSEFRWHAVGSDFISFGGTDEATSEAWAGALESIEIHQDCSLSGQMLPEPPSGFGPNREIWLIRFSNVPLRLSDEAREPLFHSDLTPIVGQS